MEENIFGTKLWKVNGSFTTGLAIIRSILSTFSLTSIHPLFCQQVKRGAEDQKKKLASHLDAVHEFDKLKENLGSWLNAKTKMAGVLGPLAIEPAMIENQLEQVSLWEG